MFAPDVEARFKKIDDELTVAAELLRRFERKTDERVGRVEAVQDAMATWLEAMGRSQRATGDWLERLTEGLQKVTSGLAELDEKVNAIADAHIRLEATLERYLRSRTNGGAN